MKVSYKWIKEYCDIDVDIHTFAKDMTMAGQKVEVYETLADECKNVVIGKILEINSHPNADKLVVCKVDIKKEVVQIVTGATNLKVGDLVPAALDGAILPCKKQITKTDFRGVESNGMLCSLEELNLTENDFPKADKDGILVLDEDCEIGMDATVALGLDDYMVEFEITPNRPDCLSVSAIAKEAAAVYKKEYKSPEVSYPKGEDDINKYLSVDIKTENCQRYTAGMIKNVRVKESPQWLRERLRVCSVRPINNIVDITNYVMLLFGLPMHAFDYKYVNGGKINIRQAKDNETIVTLDSQNRKLDSSMMVIADEKEPIAIAGVMGGEYSGVYDDTNMVVFEAACFEGVNVRKTSKAINLRTEASGKFEKGLNPDKALTALSMALHLVKELDAGDVIEGYIDVYKDKRSPRIIPLECDKINKILGTDLQDKEIIDILNRLDLKVNDGKVVIPTDRYDIAKKEVVQMNDLAEEVARIYGYDKLPSSIMKGIATARPTPMQTFTTRAVNALLGFGYYEIETYSFYSPKNFDLLNLAQDNILRNAVVISNPLGEDTSIMRTTAVASMMNVVQRNYNSRIESVDLFENATEYTPTTIDELPIETAKFILASYGKDKDFFYLKGVVEKLITSFNIENIEFIKNEEGQMYHPGRCADILIDGIKVGVIGQIHPIVCENLDMKTEVYVADLDSEKIFNSIKGVVQYEQLSRFPSMSRDLALVCKNEVTNGQIIKVIKESCPNYLESVKLFDVYTGAHIEEGKKSMAYNIVLRDKQQTLTEKIAQEAVDTILDNLSKIDIFLRV